MLKRASAACQSCGAEFTPKREWQGYCSPRCKGKAAKRRFRAAKCVDTPSAVDPSSECVDTAPSAPPRAPQPIVANILPPVESYGWGKPGDPPLQGDDYQLEYYPDGDPELPACLDRREERQDG